MKRIIYVGVVAMLLAGLSVALAGAQSQSSSASLGDYARSVRKDKVKEQQPAAARKYDNDNLPKNDKLSIVGNAPETAPAADATAKPAQASDQSGVNPDAAKKAENGPESSADRQKRFDDWKNKIAAQKDHIDLLSRELDVEQREYRLRAASFYGDAGNRLRNASEWDKEDTQYKAKIAEKQKGVDEAKRQLQSMQEQARRDGVPNSMRQ